MINRPLLLIIDAMSQVFRAYYAIRGLTNNAGRPTNATYGFALMLNRVIEKFPPDYVAMVFESKEPTHRHIRFPDYKANRDKTPPDLDEQIPDIRRLCEAMNVRMLEFPGQEADDVIGTLAVRAANEGLHPVIVTLDKDMMQLVDDRIRVLNTSKDDMLIGPAEVEDLYGVRPDQITDLLGLWGDSSDNVPGAPGIGEKGAKALVAKYGSIEECLAHAEEVAAKRQRESLLDNRDQILLSKELVTINTAVPIEARWDDLRVQPPDRGALIALLRELDFTTLLKAQLESDVPPAESPEVVIRDRVPESIDSAVSVSVAADRVRLWMGTGPIVDVPLAAARDLLADPCVHKVLHDAKQADLSLLDGGMHLAPPYDDVMLMAYLLEPNSGKYALSQLAADLFGENAAADEAHATWWIMRVFDVLRPKVREQLEDLYTRVDLPLVPVLATMERTGIRLDVSVLEEMSTRMAGELTDLTARIYELAGEEFNISSPKQLGAILFEKLNLPPPRKLRKSGQYSTAVDTLENLAETYDLPRLVLDYRQRAKFKSTYVDALPKLIDEQSRLHSSFAQTVAATGRLSSRDPNLQNIPIRTALGRDIRAAFVTGPGTTMLSADYSQVELRILAHLSEDSGLIEAFDSGADIHRSAAAEVLDIAPEDVTSEQRSRAKAVNFGIVYGQTPFGLARSLGISREEAEDFIDRYFGRYPRVQEYIQNALAHARETGSTRTMFGRIRPIPEINSRNGMVRSGAERMAINAPIQGSAADIIKLAMIRIDQEFRRRRVRTRMVLQVHDELLFEVPEGEEAIVEEIRGWMCGVTEMRVPLVVDTKSGPNWRDLA
jgi:DNA polymerase-1